MEFCGRYQLLDLVHQEDGIKSFEAFDVQTNGPVQVHIFERTGTNTASIVKSITQEARERIIEQGSEKGDTYFVTGELPAGINFREWLLNPAVVVPELLDQSPATRPRKSSRKKTSNAGPDVGKFSRMFQSSSASESQTATLPQQLGEFSRMFQSAPAAPPLPPSVLAARSKVGQGEFSRMFQGTRSDQETPLALPSAGEPAAASESKLDVVQPLVITDHPTGEQVRPSQAQTEVNIHFEPVAEAAGPDVEPAHSILPAVPVAVEKSVAEADAIGVSEPNLHVLSKEKEPVVVQGNGNSAILIPYRVAPEPSKHNARDVIHLGSAHPAGTPPKSPSDQETDESLAWLLRPDPAPRRPNVALFFANLIQ